MNNPDPTEIHMFQLIGQILIQVCLLHPISKSQSSFFAIAAQAFNFDK
jgi:hypothetical protein